jgi:hypothetical protein
MTKGLENILAKIIENPRQTLVGRYLSLIADIPDEDERAGYALDLAENLVKAKPDDALKIAYMIYGSGRHLTRALKVVIECFETKGRPGKVAVLKLELEKLTRELNSGIVEAPLPLPDLKTGQGAVPPQFSFNDLPASEESGLKSHDTRMAELDLGDLQEEDYTGDHTVDFLFNGKAEKEAPQLEPIKPDLKIAEGFFAGFSGRPGDTVLPVMPSKVDAGFIKGSGTAISVVGMPEAKELKPKIDRVDLPWVEPVPAERVARGIAPNQPFSLTINEESVHSAVKMQTPAAGNQRAAASEIFDRFFADRKYREAEALLQRSNNEQMFEWWRVRYERLKDIVTSDYKFDAEHLFKPSEKAAVLKEPLIAHLAAKPSVDSDKMEPFNGDFRRGFITEILALSTREPGALVEHKKFLREEASESELSPALAAKLISMPIDSSEQEALFFDLFQSLLAGGSAGILLDVIEKKGLSFRSPEWFGLYLDGLLSCGFARKVIADGLLQVEKQPKLAWIRVVWRRLPEAWEALGVTGFSWSEDDGAKDFLNKINVRGQQLPRTFIYNFDAKI